MPTHWESSKRPLFVRTVVVDGNRHAILSEEDPIIQTNQISTKPSRPSSGESEKSNLRSGKEESIHEKIEDDKEPLIKGGRKGIRDLQSCLIKLRLVLATQEKRKALNSGQFNQCIRQENKKRKRFVKKNSGKRSCDWHAQCNGERNDEQDDATEEQISCKYDNSHKIAVATFFAAETYQEGQGHHHNHITSECEISYTADQEEEQVIENEPTQLKGLNLTSNFDIPWNTISADCYFTRPFYNRLSERVLQWIDHASKRSNGESILNERKAETQKTKTTRTDSRGRKSLSQRESSEDNYEEVKNEKDVDTILSTELPKFSEELNRLHQLKSEIPVKESTNALQDSIAESFTNVVSIRSGKYALPPKITQPEVQVVTEATLRRRSHLKRQQKLEESSSDDEENTKNGTSVVKTVTGTKGLLDGKWPPMKQTPPIAHFPPQLPSKLSWLRDSRCSPHWPVDLATPKPQLHIFIPAVSPEDDSESENESDSLC